MECSHSTCGCSVTDHASAYCSLYCSNVDQYEPLQGACACGHAACSEAHAESGQQDPVATSVGPGPAAGKPN